jgi:hypothetical protein
VSQYDPTENEEKVNGIICVVEDMVWRAKKVMEHHHADRRNPTHCIQSDEPAAGHSWKSIGAARLRNGQTFHRMFSGEYFDLRDGDSPSMDDDIENDTRSPARVRCTAT